MFSDEERHFLLAARAAHLATADADAVPHVVPVCFVLDGGTVYITIDEKPKRLAGRALKRVRNIVANPNVALIADRYDDRDWSRLGWVMVRGRGKILDAGVEHDAAQALLKHRYTQLATMTIDDQPVIAIRVERVSSWGNLSLDDPNG